MQHIIHCRHCGTDNEVAPDIVGKRCDNCGNAIFSPEVEKALEIPHTRSYCSGEFFVTVPHATGDRSADVLRVVCPHCKLPNEFAGFDCNHIFVCDGCGAPVAVDGY